MIYIPTLFIFNVASYSMLETTLTHCRLNRCLKRNLKRNKTMSIKHKVLTVVEVKAAEKCPNPMTKVDSVSEFAVNIPDEFLLAITDDSEVGYFDGGRYLAPLAVAKHFIIPEMYSYLVADISTARLYVEGEKYIASVKIGRGETVSNQAKKRCGRLVWNYAFISKQTELVDGDVVEKDILCSLSIFTNRSHTHSKHKKN